jgi:hypothetical protein
MEESVKVENPVKNSSTEVSPKSPELRDKFNRASGLGRQLMGIDGDRRSRGFSCFRANSILSELSLPLKNIPDEELSEEKISEAKKATFGFSLEGARQIAKNEMIQPPRGVRDDTESMAILIRNITESSSFANQLKVTNPDLYKDIAKKVFAQAIGKNAEALALDENTLFKLVTDTYAGAQRKLINQADSLKTYLRR